MLVVKVNMWAIKIFASLFSELHPTQSVAQQVLHQGTAAERRAREGWFLEDWPTVRWAPLEWCLQEETNASCPDQPSSAEQAQDEPAAPVQRALQSHRKSDWPVHQPRVPKTPQRIWRGNWGWPELGPPSGWGNHAGILAGGQGKRWAKEEAITGLQKWCHQSPSAIQLSPVLCGWTEGDRTSQGGLWLGCPARLSPQRGAQFGWWGTSEPHHERGGPYSTRDPHLSCWSPCRDSGYPCAGGDAKE